jgi:3-hydroxyisobutyrate dehydrogenase-like beta-hydroxyacid dehydrogenase
MSKPRIGFAGMGLMGSRMARNLLAKGFPLTVWSRNAEKCRPLTDAGAKTSPTPRALGESTDVVVACVADPPAVERLLFAEDGIVAAARPGFRYVEASTISPDLARRTAESLRAKGADALEAPMTGSKGGAENATLLFMTGGRREVHDELQPVLMAMGTKAIYCGETGQAATMKLIGNSLISFMLEGLCEGLVVGRKAGLSIETMIDVVMASGYASPYFRFKGEAIARRDFEQQFSIDLLVKDQTLMLAEAARLRVPMPGLAAIREAHQSARALGFGQDDIAGVVKALEKAAGLA